ncbi:hypothetical protein GQR60_04205 [Labilibaculum sp. A4]|uniref:FISUMP domain-containing protein n=1 Tax=Labilibaculum euxinus TaxID=2686357 RepID=UPI000F61E66E|nr:FISUMP domain-containing protein [Labilibaculum euxinus]MDQ1772044.1 FISUMP domain-containing protein [Labilibaculum euxinus]MWN75539.1 hypothetical protein [Labilibaculum euxinus]
MKRKRNYLIIGLLISLIGLIQSCDKKEDTIPSVATEAVTDADEDSAYFHATLESDGGHGILEYGFCYGKITTPTLSDSITKAEMRSSGDAFSGREYRLEDGVKYYVRAYAKNEVGLAYGNQVEFTTIASKLPKLVAELLSFDSRTATCKVNVTYDGGFDISEHGIVIGENYSPHLSSNIIKEVLGKGKGEFSITIKGLKWEKTYHLKAYATNENGTTYSEEIIFETPTIYGSFVDERDGNVYRTLKIGSQTWMVDNLKYLPQVYPIEEGNPLQAYAYVRAYDGTNVEEAKEKKYYKDGFVYYNLVAAQLSCPEGWHLPTDEEWIDLELAMGMDDKESQNIGKRESLTHVDIEQGIYNMGFDMFFYYGNRYENGDGEGLLWPVGASYWTNTEFESGKYLYRYFGLNGDEKRLERRSLYKSAGFCVRCVKDE